MSTYKIFNFLRADTSTYISGIELQGLYITDSFQQVGQLPDIPQDTLLNFMYGANPVLSAGAKLIEIERDVTIPGFPYYDAKISTYLQPGTAHLYKISRNDSITKAYICVNSGEDNVITKAAFLTFEPDDGVWYLSQNITELVDALEGSRAGHRQGELAVKVKTTDPNKPFYFSYISDATYPGTYWASAQQYPFPVTGCRDAYDILYTKTNNWHNVMWNDDEENIMATTEEASSIEDFIENFVKPNVEVLGTEIMEYALESMIGVGGVIFTLENGVNFYATPTGRTNYGVAYWNFYLRDSENNIITFKDRNGSTYPASWVDIGIGEATEHPSGEYSQNGFQALYLVKSPKDTQSTEGEIALVGVIKKHTMSQSTPERYFLALVGEPAGSRGNNIRTSIVLGETSTEILDEDTTTIEPTGGEIPEPVVPPGGDDTEDEGSGGEANYNDSFDTDSIEPPVPDAKTVITGTYENNFARIYNPSASQLRSLADYMTDTSFFAEVSKYFKDPMDFLVSLHECPGTVTQGELETIKIGTVSATNVQMHKVSAQKKEIDCGSVVLDKRWGSCNDYAPHVNAQIYLPFIGYNVLDANLLMPTKNEDKCTLNLKYIVNYLNGSVTATLYKTGINKATGLSFQLIVGQWAGNGLLQYPITASKNDAAAQVIASVATTAATLAVSGALAKSANKASEISTAKALEAADIETAIEGATGAAYRTGRHMADEALVDAGRWGQKANKLENTAQSVKTFGQMSGASSVGSILSLGKTSNAIGSGVQGSNGYDMIRKPYLLIERSQQVLPAGYVSDRGLPAHINKAVKDATTPNGFLQYSFIKVDGVNCTAEEKAMIEASLLGGVIL